ncbi:integrase domain protein SAM domain protein (plasmid) [Leptolyngbya boryana NIES-2135]|jgi:integrase/recombinase XerD|uniref:Integrase domain protein SAM domain protein n=1 Tax=Leptolyngbya boryana NIES-2135 TaxID=1973484 RepID=A0A1Z4JR94_LEPBY|nr:MULTISPECIES: tyrosine-type recombinase/integrase [Leptolyngbya]BAY59187.1 integrase domain protein SAM domain protein [Leptolyngbya boryana NIES-2135]MBD2372775.1 tyrosine-type recombinase/integrase [Leptolyngbya sp. FACHB-238]MBD2397473.1 tyrosine-type recombinase/integrase [Leptolyngbya sp. FACHB-239]MBD2403722.1 tyrosine-type recombinase/integrase [Leptolyngbya sp. FACHB-402]ULP33380.1 tyrosine-type recombinase/integrase [Leptolyngbya boryana IU 594]
MPQSIPDPIFVVRTPASQSPALISPAVDLRASRIEEFLIARSLSENSKRAYRQDLKAFTDWTNAPWAMVSPRMVAQFKAHLMQKENGKRVRSDATVRRILGTLKNFFGWMVRSRYIEFDPTLEIDLPKLPEPEADALSETQVEKLLDAAIDETTLPERNLAILMLLLHGLRASEVCALNVEDYQDGRRLHIRQSKANSKGTVPLNAAARAALNGYLGWRKERGEALESSDPLFVSYSRQNAGARLAYGGIRTLVDKLSEKTGIDFHSHQGRHTFGTNHLMAGMNPHHIMTIMRHKNPNNFRRYTKAAEQVAAEKEFYRFEE